MIRTLVVALLAVCITGCATAPANYPIPAQHQPLQGPERTIVAEFVAVNDPGSYYYFVSGVMDTDGAPWRWTHARPELRFRLASVKNRKFRLNFTIHDVTFKDTGPLTIHYNVNGNRLATVRYDKPGVHTFEQAVPENWLLADDENRVVIEIANPWRAPSDGALLGVLLHRAGFVD